MNKYLPWISAPSPKGYGEHNGTPIVDAKGYVIGVAIGDVPELDPDRTATLWSAAPEMLAALRRAESAAWLLATSGNADAAEIHCDIRAAIAKATSK